MTNHWAQMSHSSVNGMFFLKMDFPASGRAVSAPGIWVASSNAELLGSFRSAFDKAGVVPETRLFRDGFELLRAAKDEVPGALFLELGVRGVDGFAVLKALRQDRRFTRTHIFILTRADEECRQIEALAWGASGHLPCPATPAQCRKFAELIREADFRGAPFTLSCEDLQLTIAGTV